MNPYLLLVPVLVLCLAGSAWTYSDDRGKSFVIGMAVLGAMCAALFAVGVRELDSKARVWVFSLCWDVVMLFSYYAVPILVLGVRVSPGVLAGMLLVVAGLVLVKVCE